MKDLLVSDDKSTCLRELTSFFLIQEDFYFLLRFILTQMSYISFLSSECPTFKSLILPPGLEYSTSTVCIPHKNVWCPAAQGNLVTRDIYNDSIFPSFSPSLPPFLPFIFPPLIPPSFLYSLSFSLTDSHSWAVSDSQISISYVPGFRCGLPHPVEEDSY